MTLEARSGTQSLTAVDPVGPLATDIELVCFDLGRVLIHICDDWEHACREAGVAVPATLHEPQRRQRVRELAIEHETGRIDADTFDRRIADLLALSPEEAAAVCRAWLREPCPRVDELLDEVIASGVRTACLSNTNDRHWGMMLRDERTRLPLHRLDHHFTSFTLGVMKPDPAIYEKVEAATGVEPRRIAFFDDLPANVETARLRGWQAHLVERSPDPVSQIRAVLTALNVLR